MTEVARTLHELGGGVFAYTQLPGSWGWSNAGLISDGDQCLLVDTLFDRRLTTQMLQSMRQAVPAAQQIRTVVNTHGNGDHCYGNGVVGAEEIIGTPGCVADLNDAPPSRNATLLKAAGVVDKLGGAGRMLGRLAGAVGLNTIAWLADAAPLALPLFRDFEFDGIEVVPPNRTFQGELELTVGDKEVMLIEVGPAHTNGDAIVWVPGDRVVFTGDILFHEAHPVIWEGPIANWIQACDRILALDVETVVPGHGPLADLSAIQRTRDYLSWLLDEAQSRHGAGQSVEQAARELSLDAWNGWIDAERIYVNLHTAYREISGAKETPEVLELFAGMARLVRDLRRSGQ